MGRSAPRKRAFLRLGVDLGGSKIEGVVIDARGEILLRERRATPAAQGYEAIVHAVCELVRELERRAGRPCRVGIGTPGSISVRTGCLKNSNTVCLNGKPIGQDLERLLGREIRLANDANCFALSEALDGAGRGAAVVFGVIMGTGVGGGIVVHGRLLEGTQRIAGEWGHNVLEPDGPPCYCGKRGCVETFLSGPGLLHDYRAHGGDAAHDTRYIVSLAQRGDDLAAATLERYLDRFGRALSVVINLLDPDVVVLGGGMSNIERLYTDGRRAVERYVFAAHGQAGVGRLPHPADGGIRTSLYSTRDAARGREKAESRRERRSATPDATDDALRTKILPNVHGDSSGVRGAARLWSAEECRPVR